MLLVKFIDLQSTPTINDGFDRMVDINQYQILIELAKEMGIKKIFKENFEVKNNNITLIQFESLNMAIKEKYQSKFPEAHIEVSENKIIFDIRSSNPFITKYFSREDFVILYKKFVDSKIEDRSIWSDINGSIEAFENLELPSRFIFSSLNENIISAFIENYPLLYDVKDDMGAFPFILSGLGYECNMDYFIESIKDRLDEISLKDLITVEAEAYINKNYQDGGLSLG